jgi:hypothetical protein
MTPIFRDFEFGYVLLAIPASGKDVIFLSKRPPLCGNLMRFYEADSRFNEDSELMPLRRLRT